MSNLIESLPAESLDFWYRWLTGLAISLPILGGICGWGAFLIGDRITSLQSTKMQMIKTQLDDEVKKNAGRGLSREQFDRIAASVRREPPIKVTVSFDGNDPEASAFATTLIKSFEEGGALVFPQPSAVFIGQMPVFGLIIQASKDFDASKIEAAISDAVTLEKNESLKSFPGQSRADVFLYVGHKPQP